MTAKCVPVYRWGVNVARSANCDALCANASQSSSGRSHASGFLSLGFAQSEFAKINKLRCCRHIVFEFEYDAPAMMVVGVKG